VADRHDTSDSPGISPLAKRFRDGIVLVNLLVYACAGLYLYSSWNDHEKETVVATRNLAAILESAIRDTIDKVSLSLFAVKDEVEGELSAGGIDRASLDHAIDRIHARVPQVSGLYVADGAGILISDTGTAKRVQVADRDYFIQLRDHPETGLAFGTPAIGRVTGKWALNIARRLNQPDGSFAGVVVAQLELARFSDIFARLDVGRHGAIALRNQKLEFIARYPEIAGMFTNEPTRSSSPAFREVVASTTTEASYKTRSPLDNITRLHAVRKVGDYPLYVSAGKSPDEYMAGWRNEAVIILVLLLLFSLGMAGYYRAVVSQWRSALRTAEDLRRANEELEQRVAERTAELQAIASELRKSEERYRTVADFTSDWEFWISPEGRFIYISPSCEEVTGYRSEEFIADPSLMERIIHPDDRQPFLDHRHARGVSGCLEALDFRIITRDGTERWIGHHCRQVFDDNGSGIGWRASNRDITDKVRIEQELRASSRYTRSLIEACLDPLATISPDGIITDVNAATEALTGFSRDELIQTDFSLYCADPIRARQDFFQGLQEGQLRDCPLEIRHRDGQVTTILYNASLYRDEDGTPVGVFVVGRDMTERKRLEDNLRALNEELDQRVALRTAELERVNRDLESFCYSVSHEMRAPLARLEGFCDAFAESVAELSRDEAKHLAERISVASLRLRSVIDNLLLMTRLSQATVHVEPVDLSKLAREIVVKLLAGERGRSVKVTIAPGMVAEGDRSMLATCLENLLANAVKYTVHNPVAEIEFGMTDQSGVKVYFVRDNGVGFDMAFADKLFEPFCRLHHTSEFEGSGIGLPIVQRILERHQGRIWADAREGEGATFYFTISPGAARPSPREKGEILEQIVDEKTAEIRATGLTSVETLALLAEYSDKNTGKHLSRIRYYAAIIAEKLAEHPRFRDYFSANPHYLADLSAASILHDIGKTALPHEIMAKADRYTPEEFEQTKMHTIVAGDVLGRGNRAIVTRFGKNSYLALARDIAFYHHERWDGSGYPLGLKGEEIPLSARIVALADMYDALRSERPYKEAWPHEKAVEAIVAENNAHFDPDVVNAFLAVQERFRKVAEMGAG